ncbi:hypothetical protein BOTBODRAFT_81098, partial [Botryobasidium botryosum FD-172 SS1]
IPWPLATFPRDTEAFTTEAIDRFLLSPYHSMTKTRRERLRQAILRWHSDKFEGRWMGKIAEEDRERVQESVGLVCRCINLLM